MSTKKNKGCRVVVEAPVAPTIVCRLCGCDHSTYLYSRLLREHGVRQVHRECDECGATLYYVESATTESGDPKRRS